MSRIKLRYNLENVGIVDYATAKTFYLNKFYNLFINSYEFPELDYQQTAFLLKQMWAVGSVAAFRLAGTSSIDPNPAMLVFTPFAPSEFNIYDFPTKVTLVNKRGVRFIPSRRMTVDKDVVLGYAQRNLKGVADVAELYACKLAAIEVVVSQHLRGMKMPWVVVCSPEDEAKMKTLIGSLLSDEPALYVSSDEVERIRVLPTAPQFMIDKLYSYKCALENELKEYLGFSNLGMNEKKEHLITAEVSVNDEITSTHRDTFMDCFNEFCDRVTAILGVPISVKLNRNEAELPTELGEVLENESD